MKFLRPPSFATHASRLRHTVTLILLFISATIYFLSPPRSVKSALIPSVAINKYFNSGTAADVLELLVIQDNLDMCGMIIKDFSGSMASDSGGKFTFTTDALWSSVRSGTLIVLRNNNSAAATTVGGADYNLDIGLQNTTYFTSGGGTFDIATTDMVMIKAAGSGTAGVTGNLHTLPGDQAAMNQQLFKVMFDPENAGLRLGELMDSARAATASRDVRRTWILFGDPSMRLK